MHEQEQFANVFYSSAAWKRCRRDLAKARGNMCERCYQKGLVVVGTRKRPLEVHHKVKLTPENINDPSVTLNWDNMELLCRDCHEQLHGKGPTRWDVDELGRVTARGTR